MISKPSTHSQSLIISPSLLAADILNLKSEISSVENAGADWLHIDVMDGHFVPNLSFGLPLIRAVKKVSRLPLDVHIMISNPEAMAMQYVEAGADILTFHVEAAIHGPRLISEIKSKGVKAGVSLNPGTPLTAVEPLLPYVDLVLVMSVNPGFGGQKFISESLDRMNKLSKALTDINRRDQVILEIDGGIDQSNCKQVVAAGADAVVAGTAVFGQTDRQTAIYTLRTR